MSEVRELRTLDEEGLNDKIRELKEALFNLRFQHATGQLNNPMKIRDMRREIARVCTVMTEREYGIHPEAFEEALTGPVGPIRDEPEEAGEAGEELDESVTDLRQAVGEPEQEQEVEQQEPEVEQQEPEVEQQEPEVEQEPEGV